LKSYFALFLIATIAALLITPLVRRLCERFKLLDVPADERRVHKFGIPRLGGVAIYLSMGLALATLPMVSNLLTQSLRTYYISDLLIALVPATLVLLLGVYDDLRGTNAAVKFISLGLIATLFYWMGGRIEVLAIPFVGAVHLPPVVGFLVTVFWLVGIANAFNLIDGMDGLAPGAALFSSIVILAISLAQENPLMIVVSLVLSGALAGFLRYNFNPASIFMGDSGALFVGFLLAALAVLGTQKATTAVAVLTPILAFGLPVVDTSVTMARRLVAGRPIFQGDSEHIHHMLLARGWSQRRVVLILYAVCAVFGLLAALFTKTSSPQTGFVLFVIAVVVIIAVGHLRYHEVEELRAGMMRTVGDRRVRVANNIRLRRATLSLSQSANLTELFETVKQMLEFEKFAYANLQLGRAGQGDVNERAFMDVVERQPGQPIEFRDGQIFWSWRNENVDQAMVTGSSDFWCFRLPLATETGDWGWMNLYRPIDGPPLLLNMNYLTSLFRTELAEATERALRPFADPLDASPIPLTASAGKLTV
jgi:UDP-GlcNAc:undecaprenyl-phosphate GlcNAc-1-phosphate transferase